MNPTEQIDIVIQHCKRYRIGGVDILALCDMAKRTAEVEAKLTDAIERMDRARNILTDGNPRPECNWGMLDTAALKNAATVGHCMCEWKNGSVDYEKPDVSECDYHAKIRERMEELAAELSIVQEELKQFKQENGIFGAGA